MRTPNAVGELASGTLELSRSPAAEIAAAALAAQRTAGLERADFVVVAVEPGNLHRTAELVRSALDAAE